MKPPRAKVLGASNVIEMVKAKVYRMGQSSLGITLPKQIVSLKGINEGDYLAIEEDQNGNLVLVKEAKKE